MGAVCYCALLRAPPIWIGGGATIAAAAIAVALRRRPALRNAGIALAFVAAGFAVMQQARLERGTPMLERRVGAVAITARVIDIDALDRGWRIIIAPAPLPSIPPQPPPHPRPPPLPPPHSPLSPP